MKYYYKLNEKGRCIENCPIMIYENDPIKIGSWLCKECPNISNYGIDCYYVECQYLNDKIRTKKLNSL